MPLMSEASNRHGNSWRHLLITAVIMVYPTLGACSDNSGSGNQAAESSRPAQTQEQSGGSTSASSGMSSSGMGMMDSGSSKHMQMAQADNSSSSSGSSSGSSDNGQKKREPMDGQTVFSRFCSMCHKTGMNGAPKYGNKQAWAPRIAKGKETLYDHALHGFRGMPPKGGISGLYDSEVKDAVDYMVGAAGGWKQ